MTTDTITPEALAAAFRDAVRAQLTESEVVAVNAANADYAAAGEPYDAIHDYRDGNGIMLDAWEALGGSPEMTESLWEIFESAWTIAQKTPY